METANQSTPLILLIKKYALPNNYQNTKAFKSVQVLRKQ